MAAAAGRPSTCKLKWRCRRGLLENDLFIERFFAPARRRLTPRQAEAWSALMDLADNDLLDLLLARREPEGELEPPRRARGAGADAQPTPTHRPRRVRTRQEGTAMMTPSDIKATLSFSDGSPAMELPIYKGTHRPGRDRHPQALRADRQVHLRPGLPVHRVVQVDHHLHRRRQGRAAVPRLPDRAAGREVRLPRDLLPAAVRRPAERRPAEGRSSSS